MDDPYRCLCSSSTTSICIEPANADENGRKSSSLRRSIPQKEEIMLKEFFPKSFLLLAAGVLTLPVFLAFAPEPTALAQTGDTPGALTALDASGKPKAACPLKHTDVKAAITGFMSRVTVTQEFENPFKEKIEAVYTFPLPQNAAVDDMTMTVGERVVRGKVLPREQAQAVY